MEKLKPCPFCGSGNIKHYGSNGASMYCRNCNAEGPVSVNGILSQAVDVWNTRYTPTTHRTVAQWEREDGMTLPDTAAVWVSGKP